MSMSASREVYLVKLYLDRLLHGFSTTAPAQRPEPTQPRCAARAMLRLASHHSRATARRVLRWVRARAIP